MKGYICGLLLTFISTPTFSASPDAWAEFGQRIETECTKLVSSGEQQLHNLNVIVDRYNGLVMLIGVNRDGNEQLIVCVYDKKGEFAWLSDSVSPSRLRPDYNN